MAPPMTVASEQKATVGVPCTRPTAASMPEASSGVISSRVPSSKNAASRWFGLRGSCSRGSLAGFAFGCALVISGRVVVIADSLGLRRTERDGDVVATEAERVVQCCQIALGKVPYRRRDVEIDRVVDLVEVDRRRHPTVMQ